MNLPPKLRIMPGDEDIEKTLERELHELDLPSELKKDLPDLPVANRELTKRSKESFTKQIALLTARAEEIDRRIDEHMKQRDAAIMKLEQEHIAFLHEAERDLYQIKTLRGAIELAMVALGKE